MNKEQIKIKNEVFSQLNKLEKIVFKLAKDWNKKELPVDVVQTLVNKQKVNTEELEGQMKDFMNKYNDVLTAINTSTVESCKLMLTNEIPLTVFKSFISEVKKGFTDIN